jgi:hypothetical protein
MGIEDIFFALTVVLLIKLQKILSEILNMDSTNNTTNISLYHTALSSEIGSNAVTTCSSPGDSDFRSPFQKIDINQRPLTTSTPVKYRSTIVLEVAASPNLSQIVEVNANLEIRKASTNKLMEQPLLQRPNPNLMVGLVMHNTTPDTELKYKTVMKNIVQKQKNNKAIRI